MKTIHCRKFSNHINLYCFTDVHIGSKDFDKEKFDLAIKKLKADPNGYCFFNGDNIEFTPGGWQGANNEQDKSNTEQLQYFMKLLKGLGKKVLFIRMGNHELRGHKLSDVNVYQPIADTLDIPLLETGVEEFHIYIKKKKYRLVTSHGMGGGSKRTLVNMKQAFPGADVYFTGHTHEFYADQTKQWVDTSDGSEKLKGTLDVCGGSFLKWARYARNINLVPTRTGCYILKFKYLEVTVGEVI